MKNAKALLEEGQGTFCDLIKMTLYKEDPTIFDRLDFEEDTIYLEPTLFGYCTKKDTRPLKEQLLFGATSDRPMQLRVFTNKKGVVYLPNYAYLKTDLPEAELQAQYEVSTDRFTLRKDGQLISFERKALLYLRVLPQVTLSNCLDIYSEAVLMAWPKVAPAAMERLLEGPCVELAAYQPAIEQALELLQQYFPEEWEKYARTTRRIVLFSSPALRNFATREAHGTIYLNVNAQSNTAFFLEELIHQCSHTVFNAMTGDTAAFFLVDHQKMVGELLGNSDHRTLYSAFHGIYTTGQIVDLFLKLVKAAPDLEPRLLHELQGRIALNKTRHNIGLEQVDLDNIFSPTGRLLFDFYYQQLDRNLRENPTFFDYDMRTHPVVFNYEKFKADNPKQIKHTKAG